MRASDYLSQLIALLPRGPLWDGMAQAGSRCRELLAALAEEFARVDGRSIALLDETDPRTTYELLAEWEAWAGLPDSCIGEPPTIVQRRHALHERVTSSGGQSRDYFIRLAANLGYEVTITEFRPARTSIAAAGDAITNGDWIFAWQVNAPETTVTEATAGSAAAGEPLRSWGNQALECAIRKRKPAHTYVLFTYGV